MTNSNIMLNGFRQAVRSQGPRRGFTVLIIIVAAVLVLVLGVGAYVLIAKPDIGALFGQRGSKAPVSVGGQVGGETAVPATAEQDLANLTVTAPDFGDLSLSSLPPLEVSAFNLSSPTFGSTSPFKGFSVDTKFPYTADTSFTVPDIKLDVPTVAETPAPSETPTGSGSSGSGSQPPPESQVNASNCAQFSSVPACAYVGDPNGKALCDQCKAAGL